MRINWTRAMLAGLLGTGAMTAVGLWVAPVMGMPRMNPAAVLAGAMGGSAVLGWLGHLMIGIVLALLYATVAPRLPGAPWMRGALFGLGPWVLTQLVVMPMMGVPKFSGSVAAAIGSLIGHLVYGAVLGAAYGTGAVAVAGRRAVA